MIERILTTPESLAYLLGLLGAGIVIWRVNKPPFKNDRYNDTIGIIGGVLFMGSPAISLFWQ